jgi:ParB family transcriptional regulator, chromosome partitioning protein
MPLSENSLGRSLGDVFAKTVRREPAKGYLELDIGLVSPPASNPRQEFNQAPLDELTASIKQHGILQPLVVMKREGGYEILSGERRFRAALAAGLAKVPVVIREENNPRHQAELRLVENIQREDLNPIELAKAYQSLIEQHGLTHEEMADRLSKERSSISNSLRLLTLAKELQQAMIAGDLSVGHAKALLAVADPAWRKTLANRIISEGLSVREAERLAKAGPPLAKAGARPAKPPHLHELETNLYHLFGTRVSVKERNGKGSMVLHFDSRDHFQRLVSIMDRFVKQANASGGTTP